MTWLRKRHVIEAAEVARDAAEREVERAVAQQERAGRSIREAVMLAKRNGFGEAVAEAMRHRP